MGEGDKIKVIESTEIGGRFEWDGEIIKIHTPNIIETVHRRNPITHPQWKEYRYAYVDIFTIHYGLQNIIFNPK